MGQLQICGGTVQKVVCLDRLHTTRQDADKEGCLNKDVEQETSIIAVTKSKHVTLQRVWV